jgi:hypothetical protein
MWLDYSWARPDTTGFAGVVRYLEVWEKGTRPDLTAEEVASIHAKGLPLGLYWQAHDGSPIEGYDTGIGQAYRANNEADAIGVPMHVPIFYVVDSDYTPDQVKAYFDGVRAFLDGRPVGIYGSFRIVEWARTQGIMYAVQTSSWSAGQMSPTINLYQRRHDLDTGTGAYDELLLVNAFPAWEPGQMLEPEPIPTESNSATKEQVAALTQVIVNNHADEMGVLARVSAIEQMVGGTATKDQVSGITIALTQMGEVFSAVSNRMGTLPRDVATLIETTQESVIETALAAALSRFRLIVDYNKEN